MLPSFIFFIPLNLLPKLTCLIFFYGSGTLLVIPSLHRKNWISVKLYYKFNIVFGISTCATKDILSFQPYWRIWDPSQTRVGIDIYAPVLWAPRGVRLVPLLYMQRLFYFYNMNIPGFSSENLNSTRTLAFIIFIFVIRC